MITKCRKHRNRLCIDLFDHRSAWSQAAHALTFGGPLNSVTPAVIQSGFHPTAISCNIHDHPFQMFMHCYLQCLEQTVCSPARNCSFWGRTAECGSKSNRVYNMAREYAYKQLLAYKSLMARSTKRRAVFKYESNEVEKRDRRAKSVCEKRTTCCCRSCSLRSLDAPLRGSEPRTVCAWTGKWAVCSVRFRACESSR